MPDRLFRLRRSGGSKPSDDESLTIFDDGDFTMWRTVGWRRVGAFAGRLAQHDFDEVRDAVRSAPAGEFEGDVPRGAAVEEHETPEGRLALGGSSDPPNGWARVVAVGRRLIDALTTSPIAALELDIVSPNEASIAFLGDAPSAIVADSLRWKVEHLTPDGVPLATWRPAGVEGEAPPAVLRSQDVEHHEPGAWRTLLLGHRWDVAAGELLRLWATVGVTPVDATTSVGLSPAPKMARLVAVYPDVG